MALGVFAVCVGGWVVGVCAPNGGKAAKAVAKKQKQKQQKRQKRQKRRQPPLYAVKFIYMLPVMTFRRGKDTPRYYSGHV